MRVFVIVTLIVIMLPVGAVAQQTLGFQFLGSEEEIGLGLAPCFRFGAYGVQLSYPFTVMYRDPYNGDLANISALGVLAASPYLLLVPFLHTHGDPVPRGVLVVLAGYTAMTAVLNSQHHLVFYERPGTEGGKTNALSVFVGPRAEYYVRRDLPWGRYSVTGGIRYGRWGPQSPGGWMGDHGFGLELGVEFPWDIVRSDWFDQDPLVFGGLVLWGDW